MQKSEEGLNKIKSSEEKLEVILDLMLGDEDGIDIIKKLENNNTEYPNIVIVSNRDITNEERKYIAGKNI